MNEQTTKDQQSRENKQHRNSDIHGELQHYKQHLQHYSVSTMGTNDDDNDDDDDDDAAAASYLPK
jgi:hypothetical protein